MRFGLFLPPFAEFAEPRRVMAVSKLAEDAGWDGLFLWDHMLAGAGMPVADPWITMAAAAVATTRIRLGALVTPLPRRRPWVVSRQMATLDQLCDGRLIGGIGLGDDGWAEFSSFGEAADPLIRGQMLDEALELLQRFLTGEPVAFSGRHYTVDSPALLPRPRQTPLPIWGACRWPNRRPLARIANLHGCFPIFPTDGAPPAPDPADLRALRTALKDLGARPDMDIAVRCMLSPEGRATVRDTIAELQQAGVTWILEAFPPGAPPQRVEGVVSNGPPGAR
jgi:alkanesulfonate monooxygenase SsuD/methylene tetrahydromethanopterin reductase-like flavin-dependent oxidoreductase (luciferase family)